MSPFKLRSKTVMFSFLPPEAREWSIWYVWSYCRLKKKISRVSEISILISLSTSCSKECLWQFTFGNCQRGDLENSVLKCALLWHNIQLHICVHLASRQWPFQGNLKLGWCFAMLDVLKLARRSYPDSSPPEPINKKHGTQFYSQENDPTVFL